MSFLRELVMSEMMADELLSELNKAAREVDMGYGLPMHENDVCKLREIIYKWTAKHLGDK